MENRQTDTMTKVQSKKHQLSYTIQINEHVMNFQSIGIQCYDIRNLLHKFNKYDFTW